MRFNQEDHFKRVRAVVDSVLALNLNEMKWSMGQVQGYIDGLFSFAQFKVDDRVQLVKDWTTKDRNSGWYGSQCFLKKGAKATVHARDWDERYKKFTYDLVFDDEAYLSDFGEDKGKIIPIENKSLYGFGENWLEKAELSIITTGGLTSEASLRNEVTLDNLASGW